VTCSPLLQHINVLTTEGKIGSSLGSSIGTGVGASIGAAHALLTHNGFQKEHADWKNAVSAVKQFKTIKHKRGDVSYIKKLRRLESHVKTTKMRYVSARDKAVEQSAKSAASATRNASSKIGDNVGDATAATAKFATKVIKGEI